MASILADIDTQIAAYDSVLITKQINELGSELRKEFGLSYPMLDVFKFSNDNDYNKLEIKNDHGPFVILSSDTAQSTIENELFCKLDEIDVSDHLSIKFDDCNDYIAKTIKCTNITLDSKNGLNDIDVYAQFNESTFEFPTININLDDANNTIKDCRFEVQEYLHTHYLCFRGNIPEFINVKSDTIRKMYITNTKFSKEMCIKGDVDSNKFWKEIFEFDFEVDREDYCNHTHKISKFAVKDILSYNSLFKKKEYLKYVFKEFPYRLKEGVSLTDVLDVSQFKSLKEIDIDIDNFGVYFVKKDYAKWVISSFSRDMILTTHKNTEDLIRNLPTTKDGWSVILYKI